MLCILQISQIVGMRQPTPHRYTNTFSLINFGERPINRQFLQQRKQMIRVLLDAGLEISTINREGKNPVDNINAHAHLKDLKLLAFLETQSKKMYAIKP